MTYYFLYCVITDGYVIRVSTNMKTIELNTLVAGWQSLVDLIAEIVDVPAGLIMRLTDSGKLEVFASSNTANNPYTVGESEVMENSGLYCETVIKTNTALKVPNALVDEEWKSNPDIKLNMISYLGYPINWPNGTAFGTICVLDGKENHYTEQYMRLVAKFKTFIERDLELLEKNKHLQHLAETDPLIKGLNRHAFFKKAAEELYRSNRYEHPLSIILFDLDKFKVINDTFGHQAGDTILIQFADMVSEHLRESDVFGRYGGEEFIIALPDTEYESAKIIAERIRASYEKLHKAFKSEEVSCTVSGGVSNRVDGDTLEAMILRADKALYTAKDAGRNTVA